MHLYNDLKKKHRAVRADHPQALSLRVHRALSWLQRAETETEDSDARFVFLWISFNAAYANEFGDSTRFTERDTFKQFISRLCEMDSEGRLEKLVWKEFTGSIRVLLQNRYIFLPFWQFHNGRISEEEFKAAQRKEKVAVNSALGVRDTFTVLSIVLARLYTLRNQLFHGGATWGGGVNREQLRDAVSIMDKLVPLVIDIMMSNPDALWGDAVYPVVD